MRKINWTTPATVTPYERFFAISKFLKYENKILAIRMMFKKIGAAAAAANLLFEFKIPEKKEDKLTKNKKGNVILVNSTAKLNLKSSVIKPGAIIYTKYGVNISARVTINNKIIERIVRTSSAKLLPIFLFSNFAEVQLGIKAALNVPSAKSRLNVFGNLNATKKASAIIEAPKKNAISMSLK